MPNRAGGIRARNNRGRRRRFVLAAAVLTAAIGAVLLPVRPQDARAEPVEVDLQLVLAVDVSSSMDREELEIQRSGYVAAIRDPLFAMAVRSGATGRVAVAYVEWAGPDFQVLTMPWQLIDGPDAARRFSDELARKPLTGGTNTSISRALLFSAALFSDLHYRTMRKVIDVSGDGPNTAGPHIAPTRDAVVAHGVTINALPLLRDPAPSEAVGDAELLRYFESCVIGGPLAFALPVRDPDGLVAGIRRKLILEVASAGLRLAPVVTAAWPQTDCLVGQREFYE